MSSLADPRPAACPACVASPPSEAATDGAPADLTLSVPDMHCAVCIGKVERALKAHPNVDDARVNLTLKRALVHAHGVEASDLIDTIKAAGYQAYELDQAELAGSSDDRTGRAILTRLGVAGFAMMNVMLLSVAVWSGATDVTRDMFHWISALIALPAIAFSAQPFFSHGWSALRHARLNMDVPISLAILLAAGLSLFETAQSGSHAYFDAALSLTFFLLAGRYLDHRTRHAARSAAAELTALEVPRALLPDGARIAVSELAPGDIIRALPSTRLPADGVILSGKSEIDRSLLTGETEPIAVAHGADVRAGEINLTGPLDLRVTSEGADTSLRRLADLVAVAEAARNRYTSLAEKAARIYAPLVHLLALAAFVGWVWATGDVRHSLNVAVAVLIITCPCALGLAVPAVSAAASGRLFRDGVLIKSATALERMAEIDTVVFDKTGTLTTGQPVLTALPDATSQDLGIALALSQNSSHPLAQALAQALEAQRVRPANLTDITEHPGAGLSATWQGKPVRLGRADWLGLEAAPGLATHLSIDGGPALTFGFQDQLRPEAAEAIAAIKARGHDVLLLSGDMPANVAAIASSLGIDAWEARMTPEDKAARLAALTKSGRKVMMVGDGLNDTAALAAAHVSMSPASALDAARVVSDMVFTRASLMQVARAIEIAPRATARIKENFALAAGYNAIAIPIALAGFATPLAAALAMSASSITVSLNALRLQRA